MLNRVFPSLAGKNCCLKQVCKQEKRREEKEKGLNIQWENCTARLHDITGYNQIIAQNILLQSDKTCCSDHFGNTVFRVKNQKASHLLSNRSWFSLLCVEDRLFRPTDAMTQYFTEMHSPRVMTAINSYCTLMFICRQFLISSLHIINGCVTHSKHVHIHVMTIWKYLTSMHIFALYATATMKAAVFLLL